MAPKHFNNSSKFNSSSNIKTNASKSSTSKDSDNRNNINTNTTASINIDELVDQFESVKVNNIFNNFNKKDNHKLDSQNET